MRGPDEVASRQTYTYHYDALGRRVAKSDAFGTTHFAWDGDLMAMERRGGNEITYLYHPESFVPLAQVHDGVVHHLHTDHLGTPLEASNDAGELSWQMTYTTWGNTVVEEVAQIEQRVRFQGQYFDAETGLHYNQFRYYSPEVGRFVSNDPIGLLGGENLFAYAPNPIMWVDPLGLSWQGKLISCGVPQPAGLDNPHGHHIIFKGQYKKLPKMRAALARSRAIAAKYGIDPVNDMRTLMHAENAGHSVENAEKIADKLEAADKKFQAQGLDPNCPCTQTKMIAEIQKAGAEVFG